MSFLGPPDLAIPRTTLHKVYTRTADIYNYNLGIDSRMIMFNVILYMWSKIHFAYSIPDSAGHLPIGYSQMHERS